MSQYCYRGFRAIPVSDDVGCKQIPVGNIIIGKKQKDRAPTCENAKILCGRYSGTVLSKDTQGQITLKLLQDLLCVISGTIINNDNFEP